jgi:hypothetical protein
MLELCRNCASGPKGIDGHEGLFADSLSSQIIGFRCARCSTTWTRTYTGSGGFEWTRRDLTEINSWGGVRVPPKGFGP